MRFLLPAVFALLLPVRSVAAADPEADFFAAKVRPILATYCFKCHGPDEKNRKARLRLDVRAEAMKPARSKARALVPGQPDQSELVARVFSTDETDVMPPPNSKQVLTAEQKQILKRWVADGGNYTTHWAFVPPRRATPPAVTNVAWLRNPIDRFVLARLEKERLAPSPEADRYTLVRRVTFDLTGLPPTPEEADAFVADRRPDAYERLVDRLLASPAYGERWARRWLDLARYADTNGYEKDRQRSIWPYRDWVITALNADMPFDRFSMEQLAGDMLPGAGVSGRIATGFHRNTMLNEEGGIDPLEFRFHAMNDRVATTGTVWLGLTLQCAQCHTHKYDPIPQTEYYGLFGFLNNADEPEMAVPDPAVRARRDAIDAEIARREADLVNQFPVPPAKDDRPVEVRRRAALEQRFDAWLKQEGAKAVRWTPLRPLTAKGSLPLLTVQPDDSVLASGDMSKSDTYDLTFVPELKTITAVRLEVLPDDRLPQHGPGRVYYEGPHGDFFLSEFSLSADGKKVPLAEASNSFAAGSNTAALAIDGDQQTGWSINGGQGRPHTAVFRLQTPLTGADRVQVRLLFEKYYAAGLGRFRLSVTADPRPVKATAFPADLEPLLLLPPDKLSASQRQALLLQVLRTAPELAAARTAIDQLRKSMPAYPTTLVMAERPAESTRPTYVHHRGEFLQPTDRVPPEALSALHPLPREAPRNRLTFARWLLSRDNPLVGRVTVNRHWAAFFGRGIVATVQDFGLQGDLPTHPELLDWLAVEFMERGWSTKALHRLIVTSATYRQSSRVTAERVAQDPSNRLLARGPRVRLEAEAVRDLVLRASGLLTETVGGPSVFPPQPPEVTTEGTYGQLNWRPSTGRDRYRRGLYTFAKRTAPFALFGTFDAPSGEVCVARREVSNTPLQALTMLNDVTTLEAAQELARQTVGWKGDERDRLRSLFRRVLVRPPTDGELALLTEFYQAQVKRFRARAADAAAMAGPGAGDVAERAAWVAVARALFNLDETISRG
ncbi:MAG: PSD1 and planctomycete cytochrome C domain-containing protein [Gemmataceae bacterium]